MLKIAHYFHVLLHILGDFFPKIATGVLPLDKPPVLCHAPTFAAT